MHHDAIRSNGSQERKPVPKHSHPGRPIKPKPVERMEHCGKHDDNMADPPEELLVLDHGLQALLQGLVRLCCCRGRHRRGITEWFASGSASGCGLGGCVGVEWVMSRDGKTGCWLDWVGLLAAGWRAGSKRRMEDDDDVANDQCGKIVDLAWKLGVWIR